MKLSVMERLLLGMILAAYKGNITNLKLVREGREAVSFNDEENTKLKFVDSIGQLKWDLKASLELQEVEISFSQTVINVIREALLKLNTEEQLTEQHFSLYVKFIE